MGTLRSVLSTHQRSVSPSVVVCALTCLTVLVSPWLPLVWPQLQLAKLCRVCVCVTVCVCVCVCVCVLSCVATLQPRTCVAAAVCSYRRHMCAQRLLARWSFPTTCTQSAARPRFQGVHASSVSRSSLRSQEHALCWHLPRCVAGRLGGGVRTVLGPLWRSNVRPTTVPRLVTCRCARARTETILHICGCCTKTRVPPFRV
jgi:hypothetical protein